MLLRCELIPLRLRSNRTADQVTHTMTLQECRLNGLVLLRNWFLKWLVIVICCDTNFLCFVCSEISGLIGTLVQVYAWNVGSLCFGKF